MKYEIKYRENYAVNVIPENHPHIQGCPTLRYSPEYLRVRRRLCDALNMVASVQVGLHMEGQAEAFREIMYKRGGMSIADTRAIDRMNALKRKAAYAFPCLRAAEFEFEEVAKRGKYLYIISREGGEVLP